MDYLLHRKMTNIFTYLGNLNKVFLFKIVFALYFFIGMHVYLPHAGEGGLYIPYNILGWTIIGILLGISFWYISEHRKLEFSKLQFFSWVMFLLFLIPMYYPNNEFAYHSTYRLLFVAGGVTLYGVFLQMRLNKDDKIQILLIILIAVFIQSVVGIIQYIGLFSSSFGLFEKKIFHYGIFQEKDAMTTFLATGVGISMFFLSKKANLFIGKVYLYFLLLVPFTSSIMIIAIKSKVGYIALFLTIIFQILLVDFSTKNVRIWFLSLFLGLFVGWVSTKTVHYPNSRNAPLYERDLESQMSPLKTRVLYYSTSWKMFIDNKVFGVGYGKFPREFRNNLAKLRSGSSNSNFKISEHVNHPQSEVLIWILEGGIAPLIGLIILIFSFLVMLSRRSRSDIMLCFSFISPIGFNALFELPFFISVPHWITIIFLIYFFDEIDYTYELKSPKVALLLMVFFPLMIIYNMVSVFKNLKLLTDFEALSKYKNVHQYEILSSINNPGPLHLLYDYELMKSMLDIGIKTKNTKILEDVVERSKYYVQHTPIIDLFKIRAMALKALGKEVHAVAVEFNARYLYPDSSDGTKWLQAKVDYQGQEKLLEENMNRLRKAELFLENNKKTNPDILETSSGLQYRIVKKGDGRRPSMNSKVIVHYEGRFTDGSEFDSSIKRGVPYEFNLNQVIKGWTEGLQIMREGSVYEFFIHPDLAYGEKGNKIIPGNSCLIFKVKLIEISEKAE